MKHLVSNIEARSVARPSHDNGYIDQRAGRPALMRDASSKHLLRQPDELEQQAGDIIVTPALEGLACDLRGYTQPPPETSQFRGDA